MNTPVMDCSMTAMKSNPESLTSRVRGFALCTFLTGALLTRFLSTIVWQWDR